MPVFLFTDIEGSTRLWEDHTGAMGAVIARHDAILQGEIEGHGGRITKHTGDGITAAFEAGEPLACALKTQRCFADEAWGAIGQLRIRVGLHAGAAEWIAGVEGQAGDYFGPPVNCAARIMAAAWGGQILLTPEVSRASHLPAGASLKDLGQHLLKDVGSPQQIYQLVHPDLPRQAFPPPRTLSGQSIRQAVDQQATQWLELHPPEMAVALVSATLLPAVLGDLPPGSPTLAGNMGVLQDLGAATLAEFLGGFAAQLQAGEPGEIRRQLEVELQQRWAADAVLRSDASRLLQAVQGVDATLAAATGEVREALARGLAGLGVQFDEFRWVLGDVQETLAEVRTLQQQQLAMTEELLALHKAQARVSLPATAEAREVEPRRPAFLEEGAPDHAHRPVFVAREQELAWLEGFLDEALADQGRVVFVTGGPGRGKTALLDAFARQAMEAHDELLVASGTCNAYSGVGDAYLPFREVTGMLSGDVEARWLAGQITSRHAQRLWAAVPLLAQALLGHGPHILGTLVEGEALLARAVLAGGADALWLGALRQVVARRQAMAPGAATPGVEQSHLFEQYTNVLRKVGESHPLLLILDDLQWADSASIGLLFHLGRRLQGIPILIACAYRPEEVALGRPSASSGEPERHPLEKVAAEFKRLYGDVLVDLGREDRVEGRGFIDALLDTEPNELGNRFRGPFFAHTDGHPLFAIELLRDLQERGDIYRDEQGRWVEGPALSWESLPARVEGVIEERIGRLEEDLREALTVASVEGEEFTAQVVARVQAVQERRLLRQLSQELEKRHRLVRERGEDRVGRRLLSRYRFVHHLFQRYLYNDLSAGERRLLHGEVAGVLEDLFAGRTEEVVVPLAFHYGRAGLEDRALPFVIQAGHRARAQFANEEAVDYYTEALRLATQVDPERFDLLASRSAVYALVARYDEAKADAQEMLTIATDLGDEARRFDALLALSTIHLNTEHLQAEAPAQEALATARELGDRVREGRALNCLGAWSWFTGDYHRSRDAFEAAIPIFTEADMPGEASRSLHWLSLALGNLNEFGPALGAAERSVALSREAGDRQQEAIGLRRIAIAYLSQHQHADALPYSEQALVLHQELGDRAEESAALNVVGIVHAYLGGYEQSERYLRQSLELAESIGSTVNINNAAEQLLALHYERRGDYEDSLAFLAKHVERARLREDEWLVARLQAWQGASLYDLGQYAASQEVLEASFDTMARVGSPANQSGCLLQMGTSQALAGDYETALENLRHAAQTASEVQDEYHYRFALMLQGLCALLEGEREIIQWGLERIQVLLELLPEHGLMMKIASYWIMAGLKLALGEVDEALGLSSEGLRLMDAYPCPRWPERSYFTHSRILRALGQEGEADEYLQRAYDRVMLVAGRTQDRELKRSWLENVEVNREILAACAQRGIDHVQPNHRPEGDRDGACADPL